MTSILKAIGKSAREGHYSIMAQLDPEQKERKRHSKYEKWKGDDRYSYALFIRGRVAYSGMDRGEAKWRRDRYVQTGEL